MRKRKKRFVARRKPREPNDDTGRKTDRRVTYADLTDAGRTLLRTIFPDHAEQIRKAVSSLTPEEQDTAIALLKKLGLAAKAALP